MKKVRIKSAAPFYFAAAVWLLAGLFRASLLLHLGTLLIVALLSLAAYAVGAKIFPGREIEIKERVDIRDVHLKKQIEEGRSRLQLLREHNDSLPDPVISERIDRLTRAGDAIFDAIERDPSKATQVHRFMSYYLPTTEKIASDYVVLSHSPAKGENIQSAMRSVENSLAMIADAFEKQLDSLYRDKTFDMEAEISVLETVLKSEGLVGGKDFSPDKKNDETPKSQPGI